MPIQQISQLDGPVCTEASGSGNDWAPTKWAHSNPIWRELINRHNWRQINTSSALQHPIVWRSIAKMCLINVSFSKGGKYTIKGYTFQPSSNFISVSLFKNFKIKETQTKGVFRIFESTHLNTFLTIFTLKFKRRRKSSSFFPIDEWPVFSNCAPL